MEFDSSHSPSVPSGHPKKAQAASRVTPDSNNSSYDSLQQRMTVDKNILDELLLVCGVIGTTTTQGSEIVPVTDCLNWLQDLQRALRRDDEHYRPISLLLGDWKIVQQKLLPLVLSCRYDTAMILTVCKILVILTKPLAENTVRAGKAVIDVKKKGNDPDFIQNQIKLRENALKQADTLMEYKRAVCHQHIDRDDKTKEGGGVLSVFVSLLAEPLSRTGNTRSDADHLTIELVLHLFRNLLSAEPLLHTSSEAVYRSAQLHNEFIVLLEKELVLEIILVLGADLEQRENVAYNLLVMELLQHILRNQDPTAVAKCSTSVKLKQSLIRDKQTMVVAPQTRHSHFGGRLVVERHGRKQLVSTARVGETRMEQAVSKRKNKKSDPFIGHTRKHVEGGAGPAQVRAWTTLDTFCHRFMAECYGPVMKSLKNEFRRDSARLEDGDRVVFFRIVWFFCQWWRVSGKKKVLLDKNKDSPATHGALGQLIFTMDVFTFNLVLNATDTFQEHKMYPRLAQTVALLSEMTHLLHVMQMSTDSTETMMSLGLMDRLFYGSEPLDRLPKLLSKWEPGTSTREYLSDLAEVCHMTLKVLDANAKASDGNKVDPKDTKFDTIAKMKASASDFDVTSYLVRRIVSNQTAFMYTQLLSQYATNAPHTNHRVMSLFLRLARIIIAKPEESKDPDLPKLLLATNTVTLEPMLFNVQLLVVLDKILNDSSIRNDQSFSTLLSFATNTVYNFGQAAQRNPLLLVESLLKHPFPHRFCEQTVNMYVNEELRMIEERELLLEAHASLETAVAKVVAHDSDDEDEELEFEDFGIMAPRPQVSAKAPEIVAKRRAIDSDDESSASGNYQQTKEGDKDGLTEEEKEPAEGGRLSTTSSGLTVEKNPSAFLDDSDSEEETGADPIQAAHVGSKVRKRPSAFLHDSDSEDEMAADLIENATQPDRRKSAEVLIDQVGAPSSPDSDFDNLMGQNPAKMPRLDEDSD